MAKPSVVGDPRSAEGTGHAGARLHTIPYGHDARAAAVRRVASLMVEHLDGLAVRSASEIWNREVEFHQTLSGPSDLVGVCRTTMGSALRSLESGTLEEEEVAALRAMGRASSQQGTPLEVVLRGLRVDFLVLWSEMLLVARTTDPTTQQSLINASEIVWGAVDAVTAQFTIGYRSNHEARVRAENARREEVLLRALNGDPITMNESTMVLGLATADEVVVAAVDAAGPADTDELERRARYASMHSCWARRGDVVMGVIATRGRPSRTVEETLRQLAGARAGVSMPRRGTGDLPDAAREAMLALATMRPGATGVATLFDDPTASLVLAQPGLAGALVGDVLAPVLSRPARERDLLLETLVAFDDADGQLQAVAERLFCHRNTVLNRMSKITRLTGISFASPTGLALVALAARTVRAGLVGADGGAGEAPPGIVRAHSPGSQSRWSGTSRAEGPVNTVTPEASVSDADA